MPKNRIAKMNDHFVVPTLKNISYSKTIFLNLLAIVLQFYRVTWLTADQACKNMGAELVAITSEGEQKALSVEVNIKNDLVWIGLSTVVGVNTFDAASHTCQHIL